MKNFIKALYADLLHRIDVVVAEIDHSQHHEDIKHRFIAETLKQFQDIRGALQNSLDTGILEFDEFTGNNLFSFNRLHRDFNAIHSYRYLAIKNYKEPEVFFFRLISQIYNEHRINALPPIVSTISNHDYYYWAVPYFEIIALPSGEENSLLNLPDLYHEIGHLLHSMFAGKSCELTAAFGNTHFQKEIVRVEEEGNGIHYVEALEYARYHWSTSWIEEFTCDLVGAYMTGGAYAWTNLKLLSTGHGSSKIFDYSDSHPSDDARMALIILMLEKLGLAGDKAKVENAWGNFLKDTEGFKPKEYPLLFPKKLLQHLIDEFYEFYQNADLASYSELIAGGAEPVAKILNDAWDFAQEKPMEYFSFETTAINNLKFSFGMNKVEKPEDRPPSAK